jgi:DNA-binding SARP family transcriptional activator
MLAIAAYDGHGLAEREGRDLLPAPPFRLALLRGFELTCQGVVIQLPQGAQRLLAYLALSERSCRRVHIAGTLWADVSDHRAAGNLRSALWRLRLAGLNLVGVDRDHLSLSPNIAVDVRESDRAAKLVMDPGVDLSALSLEQFPFGGELLPGWYDDWVVLERERQRQICLHVLEGLCKRWTAAGHYEKAVMAGLAAVACEPLRESAQRVLINAYLAEGNSIEAIRQYGRFRAVLHEELRLEPTAQMTSLLGDLAAITG